MTTTETSQSASISESTLAMLRKLYERSKRADSHLDSAAARDAAETEAAQAADMLGRLLDQYGLALADVDAQGHSQQISHGHVRESTLDFGKSNFTWKIELARAVARHNNVQILSEITHRNKVQGFVLVGLALHVEATMMLLEWLFGQIKSIASADYRGYTAEHPYSWEHIDPLRWHTSFGKGAGERLASRLQALRDRQQMEAEAARREQSGEAQEMSLAVNIGTAVRDYLEAKEPWRKEQRLANEAYEARWQTRMQIERLRTRGWQALFPWLMPLEQFIILAQGMTQLQETQAAQDIRDAESDARRAKRDAYEERYYKKHGHYPGDGRRRAQPKDTTEYTAYDAGFSKADQINLQPHLEEGRTEAPAGALR